MKKAYIRHVCKSGKVFKSISFKSRKRFLVNWWYLQVFPHKLRKEVKKINYKTLKRLYWQEYYKE